MTKDVRIRPEDAGDQDAIRRVNLLAFGQPAEADLVDTLRAARAVLLSLVVELNKEILGHALFSPVTVKDGVTKIAAVGLGPMAVLSQHQRQGIGTLLVQEGLRKLSQEAHGAVVVLGHPSYYPRFGFVPASRFGLRWEHDCPDEAFMALELLPGALDGICGVVHYRPEFDAV